ncbi:unnamed protein product, partial [Closterium sp. NIES-54]
AQAHQVTEPGITEAGPLPGLNHVLPAKAALTLDGAERQDSHRCPEADEVGVAPLPVLRLQHGRQAALKSALASRTASQDRDECPQFPLGSTLVHTCNALHTEQGHNKADSGNTQSRDRTRQIRAIHRAGTEQGIFGLYTEQGHNNADSGQRTEWVRRGVRVWHKKPDTVQAFKIPQPRLEVAERRLGVAAADVEARLQVIRSLAVARQCLLVQLEAMFSRPPLLVHAIHRDFSRLTEPG